MSAESHAPEDWSFKRVETSSIVKYGLIKEVNEFEIGEREAKKLLKAIVSLLQRVTYHICLRMAFSSQGFRPSWPVESLVCCGPLEACNQVASQMQ